MIKPYRILTYIFSFLLIYPCLAQGDIQLKFSRNLAVITLPNQILRQLNISSEGDIIFGNADTYLFDENGHFLNTSVQSSNQVIWNLRALDLESELTIVEPERIISLNQNKKAAGRISPNNRYIAVKTDSQVQLFTLPSFELYKAIPATSKVETTTLTFYPNLSWSSDSQLLLVLVDDGLVVWDIERNTTQQYKFPYVFGQSIGIGDGWIISFLEERIDTFGLYPNMFALCTSYLERCDFYREPDARVQVTAPNGEYVVTARGDAIKDGQVSIWWRNPDGNFKLAETYGVDQSPLDVLTGFCPMNSGSNSKYIFSRCALQASIWDAETLDLLQTISDVVSIVWLPNSDYFVAIIHKSPSITLKLYQVGVQAPLDTLELTSIPGFEKFISWQVGSTYDIDELASVSQDGRKVLINLGLSAVIVPIEYE